MEDIIDVSEMVMNIIKNEKLSHQEKDIIIADLSSKFLFLGTKILQDYYKHKE